MKTIHKQILNIADKQLIRVPIGSNFISVGIQWDKICLWYECDPALEKITRIVCIRGTGHELTGEEGCFIGTVIMANDALVWHVFEGL